MPHARLLLTMLLCLIYLTVLPAGSALAQGMVEKSDIDPPSYDCSAVQGSRFGRSLALGRIDNDPLDDLVVTSSRGTWVLYSQGR